MERMLLLGSKTLFEPVSRITSGLWLDQNSKTTGYLEDFPGFV